MSAVPPRIARETLSLGVAASLAVVCVAAAFVLGNLATFPNLPWYATLIKPGFTPPNWLFGPAWTTLYLLMAIGFTRVLRQPLGTPGRRRAVTTFVVQIVLNAGWSWAFFGAHNPPAGLLVIAALDVAVLVTLVLFWWLDRVAGLCLVPYPLWLAYATALNAAIVVLN